jgi:hypothetical protein
VTRILVPSISYSDHGNAAQSSYIFGNSKARGISSSPCSVVQKLDSRHTTRTLFKFLIIMKTVRELFARLRHPRSISAPKEYTEDRGGSGARFTQVSVSSVAVERTANLEHLERMHTPKLPFTNEIVTPTDSTAVQNEIFDQSAQPPSAEGKLRTIKAATGTTAFLVPLLDQPTLAPSSELRPKPDDASIISAAYTDVGRPATIYTQEEDPEMVRMWDAASKRLLQLIAEDVSKQRTYTFFGLTIKVRSVPTS